MGTRMIALLTLSLPFSCGPDCGEVSYEPRTYDQTLDEWAGPPRADGTRERCAAVEIGRCSDGKQFLAQLAIFTAEVRYFDDEQNFLGGAYAGDVILEGCPNGSWGPSRKAVRCQVVEHAPLCGDATTEPFGLPHAD